MGETGKFFGETATERQLLAVLVADVAGFSRLMAVNETATVSSLRECQALLNSSIAEYGGHVVDTAGDGILAAFPSAVRAVEYAHAMQAAIAERFAGRPPDERMHFRIGVSLGEVIKQEGRIFGDTVNIAARIAAIAKPGTVVMTAATHEQVRGKIKCWFEELPFTQLKNIENSPRLYCARDYGAGPDAAQGVHVSISTLGGLSAIDQDGRPLAPAGRKGLALLAYLSLATGFRASREKLAALFWPSRPSDQSQRRLRETVSELRRIMPGVIEPGRQHVGLVPGRFDCDALRLIEFCEASGTDDINRLCQIYKGPFLDGFSSGSNVFEDWVAETRKRLQESAVVALSDGVRASDADTGLRILQQLLAIDPSREASYRLGMELLSAKRQYDQALRYYETCKAMLARDYGIRPGPETERIRRRILESNPVLSGGTGHGQVLPGSLRSQPKTVRIQKFKSLNGSEDLSAFMAALEDAIAFELSAVHEINVARDEGGEAPAADFLLNGSLLASADRVLVQISLRHDQSGRELGGERFSFRNGEQFDQLPEMALCVALATRFESLHAGWQLRDLLPFDANPVRLMLLKAHCRYYELTDQSLREAVELSEASLAVQPDSLRACRMLSLSLSGSMIQGVLPRSPDLIARAIRFGRKVTQAVPEDVFSRCVLAWGYGLDGQNEAAVEELRYAITLNPTYATLHSDLAEHYAIMGYLSEALAEIEEAIRLTGDDVVSFWRYYTAAVAQFAAGNYAAALENSRRVIREKPGLIRGALFHAASAAALRLQDEAQNAIRAVLAERPWLTLGNVAPGFMPRFVQDRHHTDFIRQLRIAGLPE